MTPIEPETGGAVRVSEAGEQAMELQEWKVDSEGVYLCPECWVDDEDARHWPSTQVEIEQREPFDDDVPEYPYCEGCGRFPSGRKMTTDEDLSSARDALMNLIPIGDADRWIPVLGEFERAVRRRALGA